MAYTSLGLIKPDAGTLSGTWGSTLNAQLTDMLNEAISGYVSVEMANANFTGANSIANGTSSSARNAVINVTSSVDLTQQREFILPGVEKVYIVINSTSGGQSVHFKDGSNTGVVVPNGKAALIFFNGTNYLEGLTNINGNATLGGTVSITGATTLASTLTLSSASSDIAVNTNKFTVDATQGNTVVAGTLSAGVTTITGGYTGSLTTTVSASGDKDATAMTGLVGQRIISTASSDTTYTLPDAASASIPVGSTWVVVNMHGTADIKIQSANSDVITICTGSGLTVKSANGFATIQQGGVVEIVCVAADSYVMFGGGIS